MTKRTRVAVLGSTSFSASDFIDLLLDQENFEVLGISRSKEENPALIRHLNRPLDHYQFKQLHLFHDSQEILSALDDFEPDYVVNYAAQGEVRSSFDQPEAHYRTNSLANVMLMNGLRQRDYLKRFVQISTPEIYGTCEGAVTEDQAINPSSPYAASKAGADMFLSVLHKTYDFPCVITRATNVYGSYQQLYRIIPRTIIFAKTGKVLTLDGGGVAVKSYIHIRDVSIATQSVMEKGENGQIYHISPDQGISIREVVETVCRLCDQDFDEIVTVGPERPGQDKAYILDSERIRTELSWKPRIEFEQGIKEVIDWVERDWSTIQNLNLDYQFAD